MDTIHDFLLFAVLTGLFVALCLEIVYRLKGPCDKLFEKQFLKNVHKLHCHEGDHDHKNHSTSKIKIDEEDIIWNYDSVSSWT